MVSLAVLALALFGSSLIASNMGFKIVKDMNFNSDPSALNFYGVAIPHNSPWATSGDFLLDSFDGTNDLYLWKYDNSIPNWVIQRVYYYPGYGAYLAGAPFNLDSGEGYFAQVTADLPGVTIVGSQDTSFSHPARTFNSDPTAQNLFPVALTPNTTWTSSTDLLGAWFDGTNDLYLWKYDNSIPNWVIQRVYYYPGYGAYFAGAPISLEPGESYALQITADLGPQAQEPYY